MTKLNCLNLVWYKKKLLKLKINITINVTVVNSIRIKKPKNELKPMKLKNIIKKHKYVYKCNDFFIYIWADAILYNMYTKENNKKKLKSIKFTNVISVRMVFINQKP